MPSVKTTTTFIAVSSRSAERDTPEQGVREEPESVDTQN